MKELCKAMSEAFPKIESAVKDKTNPAYKSRYADLSSVVDAIKPALAAHGLWFMQTVHQMPGCASVETIIMHSSGESMSCGVVSVPVTKGDAQGYGSALTYARRYSLSTAFGVAQEDDDGNEACKKPKPSEVIAKEQPRKFMSDIELSEYASELNRRLHGLDLSSPSDEDMVKYLRYLQDTSSSDLRSRTEIGMKNPQVFIEYFCKWKAFQEMKSVDSKDKVA